MITLHDVNDQEKVQTLAESMEKNGWLGAPLVVLENEQLLTGVHRYAAAHKVLEWQDDDIPMIDIADVFAEDGLDFEALYLESLDQYQSHWYPAVREIIVQHLSNATKEKYGIDIE